MPIRSVAAVQRMSVQRHGDSLTTADLPASLGESSTGPFLMVSLFAMREGIFPPHPHAGFSVATYILPESPSGFVNQDSLGNHNRIAPGSLHVTVAGSGVLHEEQPERPGDVVRGFQIWIDHPDAFREMAPKALHLDAAAVPLRTLGGARARVLLGDCDGLQSPVSLPTPARMIDLSLPAGEVFRMPLPAVEQALMIVHTGGIVFDAHRAEAGEVALLAADGDTLQLTAAAVPTRATLFAGPAPSSAPVRHGPFVAASREQLQRFIHRYQDGGFGALRPFGRST